ncbi:MAG: hypothetical protein H7A21_15445 [Spirochaetales bacterium]|nr:hypothetical protein [Leptospiraceae bacterium]MCP5482830.1 hypothetical protein [Spirochaetales bacterium]
MSPVLFILGLIVAVVLVGSALFLQRAWQRQGLGPGTLAAYRGSLRSFLSGSPDRVSIAAFVNYVGLHLVVPLLGLGLFLRSDGNFLVVLVSIVWSLQLVQRLQGMGPDQGAPRG